MKTLVPFIISILLLTSCEIGTFLPRTANIPTVDSLKKSELIVGGGISSVEFQHNHLLGKRLIVQNNIATRPIYWLDAYLLEAGLGLYLDNEYSKSLIVGLGYSSQNVNYYFTNNPSTFTTFRPLVIDQTNFFLQFSGKLDFGEFEDKRINYYLRSDFNYSKDQISDFIQTRSHDLMYSINDIGVTYQLSRFPIRVSLGGNIPISVLNGHWHTNPWVGNYIYARIRLKI